MPPIGTEAFQWSLATLLGWLWSTTAKPKASQWRAEVQRGHTHRTTQGHYCTTSVHSLFFSVITDFVINCVTVCTFSSFNVQVCV